MEECIISKEEEWYIKKRLDDQIKYYNGKSIKYKKYYYYLVASDIIISAFIPFVSLFLDFLITRYIIAFMGCVVTIMSGFLSTFQFQKKWIEYRTTAETLQHDKYLYEMNVEPYNQTDKLDYLVKNIETLISKENTNWAYYIQRLNKSKRKDDNKNV